MILDLHKMTQLKFTGGKMKLQKVIGGHSINIVGCNSISRQQQTTTKDHNELS